MCNKFTGSTRTAVDLDIVVSVPSMILDTVHTVFVDMRSKYCNGTASINRSSSTKFTGQNLVIWC